MGAEFREEDTMFCPRCWKEYPKGMRHCDSCRVELIEGKPEGTKGPEKKEEPKPSDEKAPKK